MSGSKQHFVPQFLQRGFLSAGKRSVIVYNKDGRCFPSNISDVGASKYFYSTEHDDADIFITSLESELAILVNDLRADCTLINDTFRINKLISHLSIRSNNLRSQFFDGTSFILDGFREKLSSADVLRNHFMKNSAVIKSQIYEAKSLVSGAESLDVDALFNMIIGSNEFLSSPIVNKITDRVIQNHIESLPQALKSGHIKAINVSLDRTNRFIKDFNFKVVVSEDVVLGDSMVIYQVESERLFKTIVDENDIVNAVILPIASNKILVGSKNDYAFDIDGLRAGIAECSYDFFIAPNKSSENTGLVSKISKESYLLLERDFQKIVDDCFL